MWLDRESICASAAENRQGCDAAAGQRQGAGQQGWMESVPGFRGGCGFAGPAGADSRTAVGGVGGTGVGAACCPGRPDCHQGHVGRHRGVKVVLVAVFALPILEGAAALDRVLGFPGPGTDGNGLAVHPGAAAGVEGDGVGVLRAAGPDCRQGQVSGHRGGEAVFRAGLVRPVQEEAAVPGGLLGRLGAAAREDGLALHRRAAVGVKGDSIGGAVLRAGEGYLLRNCGRCIPLGRGKDGVAGLTVPAVCTGADKPVFRGDDAGFVPAGDGGAAAHPGGLDAAASGQVDEELARGSEIAVGAAGDLGGPGQGQAGPAASDCSGGEGVTQADTAPVSAAGKGGGVPDDDVAVSGNACQRPLGGDGGVGGEHQGGVVHIRLLAALGSGGADRRTAHADAVGGGAGGGDGGTFDVDLPAGGREAGGPAVGGQIAASGHGQAAAGQPVVCGPCGGDGGGHVDGHVTVFGGNAALAAGGDELCVAGCRQGAAGAVEPDGVPGDFCHGAVKGHSAVFGGDAVLAAAAHQVGVAGDGQSSVGAVKSAAAGAGGRHRGPVQDHGAVGGGDAVLAALGGEVSAQLRVQGGPGEGEAAVVGTGGGDGGPFQGQGGEVGVHAVLSSCGAEGGVGDGQAAAAGGPEAAAVCARGGDGGVCDGYVAAVGADAILLALCDDSGAVDGQGATGGPEAAVTAGDLQVHAGQGQRIPLGVDTLALAGGLQDATLDGQSAAAPDGGAAAAG